MLTREQDIPELSDALDALRSTEADTAPPPLALTSDAANAQTNPAVEAKAAAEAQAIADAFASVDPCFFHVFRHLRNAGLLHTFEQFVSLGYHDGLISELEDYQLEIAGVPHNEVLVFKAEFENLLRFQRADSILTSMGCRELMEGVIRCVECLS